MKELQEQFGVDQGELFQTFLCFCRYRVNGMSLRQIMDSVGESSTVHSNVIKFFAAIGYLSISGKIIGMIENETKTNKT